MRIYTIIIAAFFTLALLSCKKYADPSSEDLGYSYFPISDGDYSIFSVSDTTILDSITFATSDYSIKEEIHSPITVNDEVRYQVYVYYSTNGGAWNSYPDSVWTEFNTNGKIIRVQNNVRFVKLVFPFAVGKSWDGNISDPTNDPQNYYVMKDIYRSFSHNGLYFPKTVTVVQANDSSAIGQYKSMEVYANDNGLVYKEIKDYSYQSSSGVTPGRRQGGTHYIQKLIKHGRYK